MNHSHDADTVLDPLVADDIPARREDTKAGTQIVSRLADQRVSRERFELADEHLLVGGGCPGIVRGNMAMDVAQIRASRGRDDKPFHGVFFSAASASSC